MKGMRRWYTLFMIAMVAAIAELYGVGIGILAELVKRDLALSDTQVGVVIGMSLAVGSSLSSLPFSRWADVGVRRTVLCVAAFVMAVGSVLAGLAQNAVQFGASLTGVGVGMGGSGTPGRSMIADLYPLSRRATALAVVGFAATAAETAGVALIGYFADTVGWRPVFWTLGGVALVLALAFRVSVPEPRRGVAADGESDALPLRAALQDLRGRRTFRHLVVAFFGLSFSIGGSFTWTAPYLMRAFDKSLTEVAAVVGLLMGGAVLSAMLAGGLIVDRLAKRDLRWHLWLPCLATAASLPFYTLYFLVPDFGFAIASGVVAMFLLGLYSAPLEAAVIGSAHPRARAISLAVMGLAGGTTGGILGPVTVGVVSDWLEPAYGALSLRWAIIALIPFYAWSGVHLWMASRHYRDEADTPATDGRP